MDSFLQRRFSQCQRIFCVILFLQSLFIFQLIVHNIQISPKVIALFFFFFFFSKGDLDPRELISLYPGMTVITKDFKSQPSAVSNAKDLGKLNNEAQSEFHKYLSFLCVYLREIRRTDRGQIYIQDIDTALLKAYIRLGYYDILDQLVSSHNDCVLEVCMPELEHHKRLESEKSSLELNSQHHCTIQTQSTVVFFVFQIFHNRTTLSKPWSAFQCNSGLMFSNLIILYNRSLLV